MVINSGYDNFSNDIFFVYTYKGRLEIVLPDKIGIAEKNGDIVVMMPVVLTNTGAPRTVKHITSINAKLLYPNHIKQEQDTIELTWSYEGKFISRTQYQEKYPNSISNIAQDMLDYNNRAFPFSIFGETSVQKTYVLKMDENMLTPIVHPPFTLLLFVEAGKKCYSSKGIFGKQDDIFVIKDYYQWILATK